MHVINVALFQVVNANASTTLGLTIVGTLETTTNVEAEVAGMMTAGITNADTMIEGTTIDEITIEEITNVGTMRGGIMREEDMTMTVGAIDALAVHLVFEMFYENRSTLSI